MSSKIWSAALDGLEAKIITVEADSGGGDFGLITIVGLPDAAVSEAKERVKSALRNCGLPFPRRKITVNLAPADIKKRGPAYDLPIAISILMLNNKFSTDLSKCLLVGELSLSGEIRPITGILSIALAAQQAKIPTIFIPQENASEAALVNGLTIFPVQNLNQIIKHIQNRVLISQYFQVTNELPLEKTCFDFNDIKGQEKAKRALEISAAGGHNLFKLWTTTTSI